MLPCQTLVKLLCLLLRFCSVHAWKKTSCLTTTGSAIELTKLRWQRCLKNIVVFLINLTFGKMQHYRLRGICKARRRMKFSPRSEQKKPKAKGNLQMPFLDQWSVYGDTYAVELRKKYTQTQGNTSFPRIENLLLSGPFLIKYSSLSAPTKIEKVIRLSVLLCLSELKEKRIWHHVPIIVHSKKTDPWKPQLVGWYKRRPLHDPNMLFSYWSKKKTTMVGAKTIVLSWYWMLFPAAAVWTPLCVAAQSISFLLLGIFTLHGCYFSVWSSPVDGTDFRNINLRDRQPWRCEQGT